MKNKNRAIGLGVVAGLLPHLFCCVLPVVLGILGMIAPDFADHKIIPEWAEGWLFGFSILMLILSWILYFHNHDCGCEHCDKTHHHRTQMIILIIITIVTIAGIVAHMIVHH